MELKKKNKDEIKTLARDNSTAQWLPTKGLLHQTDLT